MTMDSDHFSSESWKNLPPASQLHILDLMEELEPLISQMTADQLQEVADYFFWESQFPEGKPKSRGDDGRPIF